MLGANPMLVAAVLALAVGGAEAGCCWLLQEQLLQGGAIGLYGSFIFRCNIDHYSPNMALKLRLWKLNLQVSGPRRPRICPQARTLPQR